MVGSVPDRILVIEDDVRIQKALVRLFESHNYTVEVASDGQKGVEAFEASMPGAVILDLKLPKMSGREVCRTIKEKAPLLPVVMLSAVSDVTDKVILLELGADDYVTKPFSPRELLARVEAAIRRSHRHSTPAQAPGDAPCRFGDISADFAKMELLKSGQPVPMTAQEFKLLKFFVQNAGRVLSREELLNEVWGYENYPSTRTVDNQLLKLRQKLESDPANPVHLRTVHRAGYKFVP
jgi:DNA-binding response OmpR family regulator